MLKQAYTDAILLPIVLLSLNLMPLNAHANTTDEQKYYSRVYSQCMASANAQPPVKGLTQSPNFARENCQCEVDRLKNQYSQADVAFLMTSISSTTLNSDEKNRKGTLEDKAYTVGDECVKEYMKKPNP